MKLLRRGIAAVAMGKLITENPGEISVVALAPLTNVAMAIRMFPTFAEDVKNIYAMGGNYKGKSKKFIKTVFFEP